MKPMKVFNFTIKMTSIGKGYVVAENIEEAKDKVNDGDWSDIYDEVGRNYGEIIEIEESN